MQMNLRVLGEEGIDLLGLVRREVVGNDVNLFAPRLVHHDVGEKGYEFSRGVAACRLAQNLTGLSVERCVQRQRAMAVVLEAVALGATRRQWQHWVFSVE